MPLATLCHELRRAPFGFVSDLNSLALAGLFSGYGFANSSIQTILADVAQAFPGSSEMPACSRAYLACGNPMDSFERVLAVLEHQLSDRPEPEPVDARYSTPFADVVLDAIAQQRTGLVLWEPTVMCLYDTWNGYLFGVREFDVDDAKQQQQSLEEFSSWLRRYYRDAQAPWYAQLRVYEGCDSSGLKRFAELYRAFARGLRPGSRIKQDELT